MKLIVYTDASVSVDGCFAASILLTPTMHIKTICTEYATTSSVEAELLSVLQAVEQLLKLNIKGTSLLIFSDSSKAIDEIVRCMDGGLTMTDSTSRRMQDCMYKLMKSNKINIRYKSADVDTLNGITTCHMLCKRMRRCGLCGTVM